jgi:hypothetical protein
MQPFGAAFRFFSQIWRRLVASNAKSPCPVLRTPPA